MGSHKKTTSESILELVNPVPTSFDPEDDIDSESAARVVQNYREDLSDDDPVIPRFKKDIDLLEDQDVKYSGRKISRKALELETPENKAFISGTTANKNHSCWEEEHGTGSCESSDAGESEGDEAVRGDSDNGAATDDGSVDTDSVSADEDEGNGTDDSFSIITEGKHLTENKNMSENECDSFKHVTNRSFSIEIEKGRCVRNQLRMWDCLLECRIHLQKCLLAANRMPSQTKFEDYKWKGNTEFKDTLNRTQNFVTELLEKFIVMREAMLKSFPETKNLSNTMKGSQASLENADEEIPSDTEEEEEEAVYVPTDGTDESLDEPKMKKRKIDEYATLLDIQHSEYVEYRNNIIQKWNDKTRVSSGKISNRNFSNFEHSTLKQIEQILSNRRRLIQRTQLKRASYGVIGQEASENENAIKELNEFERLKEYDPEIFDDSDFYHQLLRELIERKTSDVTDPVQLGRQWLELQKLRSKMKRKVDVRATKGRRIRYVVHPKLVNFMAPVVDISWTDEAKSELYNSLFEKKKL